MCFAPQGRFFDTSISIKAPSPIFFASFDFPMCFARQWAAIFQFLSGKPPRQRAFFSNSWSHRTLENICFCDVRAFCRTCVFFFLSFSISDFFQPLYSPSWFFQCLIFLRAVRRFHFSIVGSLDSKDRYISNEEIFFVPKFLAVRCISGKWEVSRALLLSW